MTDINSSAGSLGRHSHPQQEGQPRQLSILKHLVAVVTTEKHLKEFAAALILLSKIGKELIIDSEKEVLTLRALNDAKCAFIAVELDRNFFSRFDHYSTLNNFCCKVPIKPLGHIFKNLKAISTLTITVQTSNGNRHELIFEMLCTTGVVRKHKFGYSDCDLMTAVFDEEIASHLRCAPKVFVSLLDHFYHCAELSIEASPSGFRVKSYHQQDEAGAGFVGTSSSSSSAMAGGPVTKKYMSTDLTVNVSEFEEYEFVSPDYMDSRTGGGNIEGAGGDGEEDFEELVVCSKELCAMLGFCESTEVAYFFLYFTCGGQPIKLSSTRDTGGGHRALIKVELVLATLETRRQAIRKQAGQQQHQRHQQEQRQQRQPPGPAAVAESHVEADEFAVQPQMLTAESDQIVVVQHRKKKKRLLDDSDDDE